VRSAANDRIAVIGVYCSAVPPVTALFLESENNGAKRPAFLADTAAVVANASTLEKNDV
jgi:hypothetical protein